MTLNQQEDQNPVNEYLEFTVFLLKFVSLNLIANTINFVHKLPYDLRPFLHSHQPFYKYILVVKSPSLCHLKYF